MANRLLTKTGQAFLFSVALTALPAAALEWKTREITMTAQPEQKEARAVFPFRNTGDHPVTITKVETSCGCTTAGLDGKTYQPGESGEVKVVFAFGDRDGKQEKAITVMTDEPGGEPTRLLLKVDIPTALLIEPRVLFWTVGGPPSEKSLEIRFMRPGPVSVKITGSSNPRFALRLESSEDGLSHQLWIKPADTAAFMRTIIYLETTMEGQTQTQMVYALVK